MINKNTLLTEYRNLVSQMYDDHLAKKGLERPKECSGFTPLDTAIKNNNQITLGDFLQTVKDPDKDSTIYLSLVHIYKEIDEELKEIFINAIQDPVTALHIYLGNKNLAKDKENKLLEKIKDKLPTAEKELKEGKITR